MGLLPQACGIRSFSLWNAPVCLGHSLTQEGISGQYPTCNRESDRGRATSNCASSALSGDDNLNCGSCPRYEEHVGTDHYIRGLSATGLCCERDSKRQHFARSSVSLGRNTPHRLTSSFRWFSSLRDIGRIAIRSRAALVVGVDLLGGY